MLHHTLQFMPTEDVEEDIQNLGEQACEVLIHMQLPKLSERFTSQTQTLSSLLRLVRNASMFAEDCLKPEFRGMWYAVFCDRNYSNACTQKNSETLNLGRTSSRSSIDSS